MTHPLITYSPNTDCRIAHVATHGDVTLVTCRTRQGTEEVAREAQAWGLAATVRGLTAKIA